MIYKQICVQISPQRISTPRQETLRSGVWRLDYVIKIPRQNVIYWRHNEKNARCLPRCRYISLDNHLTIYCRIFLRWKATPVTFSQICYWIRSRTWSRWVGDLKYVHYVINIPTIQCFLLNCIFYNYCNKFCLLLPPVITTSLNVKIKQLSIRCSKYKDKRVFVL